MARKDMMANAFEPTEDEAIEEGIVRWRTGDVTSFGEISLADGIVLK